MKLSNFAAYWHLEETGGATRVDSSGNGCDLAPTNNPGNAAGKINNALVCNNAGDQAYVSRAHDAKINMANVTFEVLGWMYMRADPVNHYFFGKYAGGGNGWYIYADAVTDDIILQCQGAAQVNSGQVANTHLNQWLFFDIRVDDSTTDYRFRLWLPGDPFNSPTVDGTNTAGAHITENTAVFELGGFAGGVNIPQINFDEVGFYRGGFLTDPQLAYIYNAGAGRNLT